MKKWMLFENVARKEFALWLMKQKYWNPLSIIRFTRIEAESMSYHQQIIINLN